jgi:hypothetical protein
MRSAFLVLATGLVASVALAPSARAQVVFLQNDSYVSGPVSCVTTVGDEDSIAARFTAAPEQYPYTIDRIHVAGCGGGQDAYVLDIYQDDGSGVSPGTLLWQSQNAYLLDGGNVINEILMSQEPVPPPAITSGTIRVEVFTVSILQPIGFGADTNGITSQRNFLRVAGNWSFAESLGVTGDWILRVGIRTGVSPPANYFTLAPCRIFDTRTTPPPLTTGVDRLISIAGTCGVPATAKAVSLNIAVTDPTASGFVKLFPAGATAPVASAINYSAGQTRTNNGVYALGAGGAIVARSGPLAGTTQLILDVSGYFE